VDEFELIRRFFSRNRADAGLIIGIGDDGAVIAPDSALQQIHVIDTLVEGVHFPADTSPADIAYRAVAVNLSDVAAMGGRPRWMTLALTLSDANEAWLESFSRGLFEIADAHDVQLIGGDTTRGPVVTVTVTLTAEIEPGGALLRSRARVGDAIFVTGTVGDAAAGLELLQRGDSDQVLAQRFLRPTPRVALGRQLVGKANAAIDISDGLVGDLQKLLVASGVGGVLEIDAVPISDALQARFSTEEQECFALTGGDDYELCFTANPVEVAGIKGITRIGTVTTETGLVCRRDGEIVDIADSGYRHFS